MCLRVCAASKTKTSSQVVKQEYDVQRHLSHVITAKDSVAEALIPAASNSDSDS